MPRFSDSAPLTQKTPKNQTSFDGVKLVLDAAMDAGVQDRSKDVRQVVALEKHPSRCWQLKYVLFSPLFGEDCHFD